MSADERPPAKDSWQAWSGNVWTSKRGHLPPLCSSFTLGQTNRNSGGVRVPVWRSEGNGFVHCVHEYKNLDNVHSGERSQEITFDFVSAEAGIFKQARTIPGHRYQIEAWGKYVQSESPVELSLGVDLSSGEDWQAASVVWYPWNETEEDTWVYTQVTVRASGQSMTIFLKGYHPFAAQGGATLFDDVRVQDLGP